MTQKEIMAVVEHHGAVMGTTVETILADYAEDAVVITNLAKKPLVGHKEIGALVEKTLDMKSMEGEDELIFHEPIGENYVLHVFKKKNSNTRGNETYIVKDGKIVFESAYIDLDEVDKHLFN